MKQRKSRTSNKKINREVILVLNEAKTVLLQLDQRHNGECYNPLEEDCQCTLCKINKVLKSTGVK